MAEARKCPCPLEGEVVIVQVGSSHFQVTCSKCVAAISSNTPEAALQIWNRVTARSLNECCVVPENIETRIILPSMDAIARCRVCQTRRLPLGMQAGLLHGDQRKDCCKEAGNLERVQVRPDLVIDVCRKCGCRHFELTVDPGRVKTEGASA